MRYVIYPYKMSSQSAKKLAELIKADGHQVLRVYPDRNYRVKDDDLVINWGSSRIANWGFPNLNKPDRVKLACNKHYAFLALQDAGVSIPKTTTSKLNAERWLEWGPVFCRTLLTGHAGKGIVVAETADQLVDAPLYTASFPKTHEFRVHVFKGQVIDIQEKRKRNGTGGRGHVWNHGNDFVFCRQNVNPPECVLDASRKAVEALGLDFGGVDVGYDQRENKAVVFEINTAPGIDNTTLTKYKEALYGCTI